MQIRFHRSVSEEMENFIVLLWFCAVLKSVLCMYNQHTQCYILVSLSDRQGSRWQIGWSVCSTQCYTPVSSADRQGSQWQPGWSVCSTLCVNSATHQWVQLTNKILSDSQRNLVPSLITQDLHHSTKDTQNTCIHTLTYTHIFFLFLPSLPKQKAYFIYVALNTQP